MVCDSKEVRRIFPREVVRHSSGLLENEFEIPALTVILELEGRCLA
jgi:hypothetical protein